MMPVWAGIINDGGCRSNTQKWKSISTMADIFDEDGRCETNRAQWAVLTAQVLREISRVCATKNVKSGQ